MSNEKAAPIPEDLRVAYEIAQRSPFAAMYRYLIERVAALTAEVAALKAEIARRDAPVTDAPAQKEKPWGFSGYLEVLPETKAGLFRDKTDDWEERQDAARATPPHGGKQ